LGRQPAHGYITDIVDDNHNVAVFDNWSVRTGLRVDVNDSLYFLFRYIHQSVNYPTAGMANVPVVNGVPQALDAIIPREAP